MVFEATIQDRNAMQNSLRGSMKALLVLGVGVVMGLMLADTFEDALIYGDFLSTGEIVGQDWHGNVRRSSPAH